MNLVSLSMKGFKSFRDYVRIDFTEVNPGLYNVTGKNEETPSLGSNGAGKSTIWEAWHWCLFGKTLRGLKAGKVEPWDDPGTNTEVIIEWMQNDKLHTLLRSRNPNKLVLFEGDEQNNVEQSKLEEVIKMSPEIFEAVYLRGQYTRDFFDLQPAEKTALLQDVLNLTHWLDKSKKAGDLIKVADAEIMKKNNEVARLNGVCSQMVRQAREMEEQQEENQKQVGDDTKETKDKIKYVQGEIKKEESALVKKKKEHEALDKKEFAALRKFEALNEQVQAMEDPLHKARTEVAAKKRVIEHLEKEQRAYGKIPSKCPVCLQSVTAKHKDACKKQMKVVIDKHKKQLEPLVKKETTLNTKEETLDVDLQAACDALNDFRAAMRVIGEHIIKQKNNVDKLKNQLKWYIDKLQEVKEVRDLTKDIGRKWHEVAETQRKRDTILTEITTWERRKQELVTWQTAFKNIRLFLMDEAIEELEVETNRVLDEVGLSGWTVRFDSERETQSGKVSKGFSVSVYPPNRNEPVVWESWSGGEAQRLRLAGRIGLANMIITSLGLTSGVEVWDEPTQFVGEEGISSIKTLLMTRAEKHNLKIFLVDHRSYDFSGFTGKWTVIKNEKGSVLEYV